MKTQLDLPAITGPEDFLLRLPLVTGYYPRDTAIIALTDKRVQFTAFVDKEGMDDLVGFCHATQHRFNLDNEMAMILTYCVGKQHDLGTLAKILASPKLVEHVDMAFVVDWDERSWVGATCLPGEPDHTFTREVYPTPGQTIYETKEAWIEQFRPVPNELELDEEMAAEHLAHQMREDDSYARRLMSEWATDPRGIDGIQVRTLDYYATEREAYQMTGSWMANGWNLDNLVQLTNASRNSWAKLAAGMTMAADGFLPYAAVVAHLLPKNNPVINALAHVMHSGTADQLTAMIAQLQGEKEEFRLS